jgi:hypothetical protein
MLGAILHRLFGGSVRHPIKRRGRAAMRRVLLSLGFCASIAIAGCEGDLIAPENGSITLRLAGADAPASAVSGAASAAASGHEAPVVHRNGGPTAANAAGAEHAGSSGASPLAFEPLESVRVRVSGPTAKTSTFQCGPATCEGTVDGLAPGTYSVVVEGLVGGSVDHFGEASGVTVAADQNTEATIAFASFRPVLDPFEAEAVGVLRFPVSYSAVASAEGYVVEWATDPSFSGAFSQSVTGTSTEVVVDEEAEYFVRVRAVNAVVGSEGRPSEAASLVAVQSVASVEVTPAMAIIGVGESLLFAAEARDADDNVLTDVTFFWDSSDHNIATVDDKGGVTGVGEGVVIIYAVGEGHPGFVTLRVIDFTPRVALLANTTYVDFNGLSTGSEASNLMYTLESLGMSVDPFTDISEVGIIDALSDVGILVIPELEFGDPSPALTAPARQRIVDFVENGGTLMTFNTLNVVNAVFGHTLTLVGVGGSLDLDPVASAGTFFEGGPTPLPPHSATSTVDDVSVPGGSLAMYHFAGDAAVLVIPQGAGFIIYMGWDWFNAAPFGSEDGGWVEVLARAAAFSASVP